MSLSTGIALLAINASKLAKAGKSPEEIVKISKERIPHDQASFVLATVDYLYNLYIILFGRRIIGFLDDKAAASI